MNLQNKFALQLFAGEGSAANETTPTQNQNPPEGTQGNGEKAGEAQEKLYSNEDVDKLINRKFAEWQAKKDREINEAQKLAEMNAQQKAEYERDQLQSQLDEYKKREAISEMSKTARSMLSEQDINVSDELIAALVTEDADTTAENVHAFAKAFKEAVQHAVENKIAHTEPKTGGAKPVTKKDIMAIKDTAARQKAIAENIELFNK